MNFSKNDENGKYLSDTSQGDSNNVDYGIGNSGDQRDVITHHQLYASSSLLLSPKRLSPRSSSHSVSFSINDSVADGANNNNKNRSSMPSSSSSTTITHQQQQQQHLDSPNMPNLPKPPPNTLPLLDKSIVPGHTNEKSPISHDILNEKSLNEDELPLPPPPPSTISPSTSTTPQPIFKPLSSSKCTTNQSKHQETDNIGGNVSRTNSSGSIPDYLSHKLHSQMNITANILKSKRKSIAVSSMLRHGDHSSSGTNNSLFKQHHHTTLRMVKESYDSSTSTTTSESYHLNDLPTLPAKLATLSKPPITPFFNSSFRRARHSIDVRALPSYLAKKRHSTFGQMLSVLSPTAPEESSSSDDPLFAEPIAPTLSLGERVAWVKSSGPEFGIVRWIGRMPQISSDWTVGIEFDNAIGSGDGTVDGRRYFVAKENFAKFLPISELTKVDNYAGRPRSGTMLSRMSVQLKPGQLISIQRSPTTAVPHCYLNAPHHVGHDVHAPNNRHCQCHSCNHPCAHICKTRKPKGKRWTEDMAHMCHFSSKPHANMCCGGEDLATAFEPIKEPGASWRHSEIISSLRTVPTEMIHQRKSTITQSSINMHAIKETQMLLKKSTSSTKQQNVDHSPNLQRENLDSALLERTGSDLSISSLPSSSSVAEIYIGRSVLTDESDIDSETERSLDSNAKANNKQGFRSLVACFLANSLRLKSMKSYSDKSNHNNKNNKPTDRSHLRRRKYPDKHHLDYHHPQEVSHHHHHHHHENKKVRKNRPIQRLGLSSTDTSYNVDIPSSVPNTQPNNSLSSDISHRITDENPSPIPPPPPSLQNPLLASSQSSTTAFSPRFHPCNSKTNFCVSKSSPYRMSEIMQQHHIDGHISEEITNSSSSSTQRNSSDKRTSNYASSENFQSPRRRRNKGPAPKPPKTGSNNQQPTEYSISPVSNTDAISTSCNSFPRSLSNSSMTTNFSSKAEVIITKSPFQQPPNLVRSLSEQKQLNMKNLFNALPSFRSEVNLQEVIPTESEINESEKNEHKHEIIDKSSNKNNDFESIYEIPLCGKELIQKDILPMLPEKTFDPLKVFGCKMNSETKRLESNNQQNSSPNISRSKSMPFAKYTCCVYHWKEYLATMNENHKSDQSVPCPDRELCDLLLVEDLCDCKTDTGFISNLTNALLSPKHSVRFKKSDFDLRTSTTEKSKNGKETIDNLLNEMNSFELIRVMSDSSLTNTTSATTVVEYIHDDQIDNSKSQRNSNDTASVNLKDVFCQTSFKNSPEKFSRRCKHKQCRCRTLRYRNHRKDCRHQYACTLHNEFCTSSATNPLFLATEKKCSNVWLTSSTSDHSLSSLSSSNSTLSETPSAMRTANEMITSNIPLKNHLSPMNLWASPLVTKFSRLSTDDIGNGKKELLENTMQPDRSTISSEKLFKSALSNSLMQTFPVTPHFSSETLKKSADFMPTGFNEAPNEFGNKNDYTWSKCLLSQLEIAIANGDHQRAAILAKELAFKKVNCSLTGKFASGQCEIMSSCDSPIVTYLYIDDKISHKGPIPFQLYPSMTVKMLKIKVEKEFDIPGELQQWIFGKNLAINMDASLSTYGITHSGCSIFLQIKMLNENDSRYNLSQASTLATTSGCKLMENETTETNGDLFEKDDDSFYESLRPTDELPPYSTEEILDNKVHVQLVNDEKSTVNYIQNPLASLDFEAINSVSSRTSFNETIHTTSSDQDFQTNSTKSFFYQETDVPPYKNELVFESLNFVNEMLPRVEEENEEELEEYDDDNEIGEFVNNNQDEKNQHCLDKNLIEQFECPRCLKRMDMRDTIILKKCNHTYCRTCLENSIELNEQDQIKCPFCDSDKENKEINDYDETTSTRLDNNQNNNNCNKK